MKGKLLEASKLEAQHISASIISALKEVLVLPEEEVISTALAIIHRSVSELTFQIRQ